MHNLTTSKNTNLKAPELIRYKIFAGFKNLIHFTTTKSALPVEESKFTRSAEEEKQRNITRLSEITGIEKHRFVFPVQIHSSNIRIVRPPVEKFITDTDALITEIPGICLCVQTADCVPVFVFHPGRNIIAMVHAGWRGTAGMIVKMSISLMMDKFNLAPEGFLFAMGPAIGAKVYEVGSDVISEFQNNFPSSEKYLNPLPGNKALLDLREANKNLLLSMGIKKENIEIPPYCTYSDRHTFYSARRDGRNTGRMVSGIMVTDNG